MKSRKEYQVCRKKGCLKDLSFLIMRKVRKLIQKNKMGILNSGQNFKKETAVRRV